MFVEVLSLTYHSAITIAAVTYRFAIVLDYLRSFARPHDRCGLRSHLRLAGFGIPGIAAALAATSTRSGQPKSNGTDQAPWALQIAPLLRHQSGQPFGRTFTTMNYSNNVRVLAEPIGTCRMDNITIFDARVKKEFGLSDGRRVAAFIDVFNIFNANPEQNTPWSSGPSFLQPLNIVVPRIARAGAKLEW
jgi:hypothetical protein